MTAAPVALDDTRLSKTDQFLHRAESVLNVAGGLVILLLVLVAVINVLGRKLFNLPLPGFIDWVQQFMAIVAFVGIAYCQRNGGHVRMDVVIRRFRGRLLWMAELLSVLLIWLVTTFLIYGSWHHFLRSFDFGSPNWSRDSSIDIGIPLWPAKLIIPLALAVLWVRLIIQIWAYWRAFRFNLKQPAAVPLLLDTAQQAASEGSVEHAGDGHA